MRTNILTGNGTSPTAPNTSGLFDADFVSLERKALIDSMVSTVNRLVDFYLSARVDRMHRVGRRSRKLRQTTRSFIRAEANRQRALLN